MINERALSQGSWDIQLRIDAPYSLWDDIQPFGHILITPQEIGLSPDILGDTGMLGVSRYTGVVLEKTVNEEGIRLGGAGLEWWLGDEDGKGEILESKITLTDSTLDNALVQLLPASILKGTVTEPAGTVFTGTFEWETSLSAIRTVCASMGAEYKVRADGYLDAGPKEDVYTITDPEVVIVRHGYGSDPSYIGVNVQRAESSLNSRPYISRAVVITTDSDNVKTLVEGQDRTPAPTATDLHGNVIDRVQVLETSGAPVQTTLYLTTQMNEGVTVSNMQIDSDFYEIAGGDMATGDAFLCFDPPAFTTAQDTSPTEIQFRGQTIWPKKLRLIASSWPLRPGMGVYYRTPSATPEYIDITHNVQHEGDVLGLGVRY